MHQKAGVQVVAIPAVGKISAKQQAVEHSPTFRRGYRWRAGIEGRIPSLRRDYGLRRCASHGMGGLGNLAECSNENTGLRAIASNIQLNYH
jgi:transposase, IS5 family